MRPRQVLPLLAMVFAPTLFAQTGTITEEPIRVGAEARDSNAPYTIVEEMPSFPGGQEAMMRYLSANLQFPKEAQEKGVQGAVFINFVVERDGSINEVKVLRGIDNACEAEAIRVVQGMPKWAPGKQRGKEVRVQYNLPIRFKL
ncbi:MAG TPA: energy transducer TonB [Flavobacteriales bacterium]|nr:energy transducer TonB [Flavobacteriales bacterium]